jgi:ABC-type glycerol-3-phosphate transport system substrate-binding protein
MRVVRIVVALLAMAIAVTGCGGTTTTVTDQTQIGEKAIAFAASPFSDDYGLLRLTGYVDNLSESEFRAVTIEIQLSDADGNKKEKITHTLKDVPAKSRKTFDINAGTLPATRTAAIAITSIEVVQ